MKGRVLVVDDEQQIREMLRERLELEGYSCAICADGDAALETLAQEPFEVVVSDFRMPGMSGLTLLEKVRQLHPRLAFIMVTVEDDAQVIIQAMKQGAIDYLLKPSQIRAVAASVERALQKKRLELELERYQLHLEKMVAERTQQLESALLQIEKTYDGTLESLAAALDLRDGQTAGHSRRVALYAVRLAQALGLSNDQIKNLARGSYLHDIGKLGIPDGILLKKSALSAEEKYVMQTHVRIGCDLVERIDFLQPAAQLILNHHEHFDGQGYPQGRKGDEIPITARIFAVADSLDAMTSERPYRRPVPVSSACAEIASRAGRQFDPEVVRAFLSIPVEEWEEIRQGVDRHSSAFTPNSLNTAALRLKASASAAGGSIE